MTHRPGRPNGWPPTNRQKNGNGGGGGNGNGNGNGGKDPKPGRGRTKGRHKWKGAMDDLRAKGSPDGRKPGRAHPRYDRPVTRVGQRNGEGKVHTWWMPADEIQAGDLVHSEVWGALYKVTAVTPLDDDSFVVQGEIEGNYSDAYVQSQELDLEVLEDDRVMVMRSDPPPPQYQRPSLR